MARDRTTVIGLAVVVAACGRIGFDDRTDAGVEDAQTPPRVTSGLIALYTFDEGAGTIVHDVSGVVPALDLTIQNESAVTWGAGTFRFDVPTVAVSANPETKIRSRHR